MKTFKIIIAILITASLIELFFALKENRYLKEKMKAVKLEIEESSKKEKILFDKIDELNSKQQKEKDKNTSLLKYIDSLTLILNENEAPPIDDIIIPNTRNDSIIKWAREYQ